VVLGLTRSDWLVFLIAAVCVVGIFLMSLDSIHKTVVVETVPRGKSSDSICPKIKKCSCMENYPVRQKVDKAMTIFLQTEGRK